MERHEGKQLAKELFWVQDKLADERVYGMEREEYKEELKRVQDKILKSGYSIDSILNWIEEYKELRLGEHGKWITSP